MNWQFRASFVLYPYVYIAPKWSLFANSVTNSDANFASLLFTNVLYLYIVAYALMFEPLYSSILKCRTHVGHVQLQQYGFRARLIFPSYFRLFLLRASLDQSKTSTKQKTKKPSQTRHTICGNNYSLCRKMSAQTKQVK